MIGRKLAHYEITALVGKGGMGEVYRARDARLGRDVALKMISGDVARDPERLARFRREARTLASLSHPHIAQIFGIEHADDHDFLVMELVEGEDLFERLKRGPLGVDEALATARAIAEALETAHEQGIVHRDLKPANVKCGPDGEIKLLDFGLARAALDGDDGADPANSPTVTAAFTQAGTILGTAAYMAPEQARGRTVDRRADIWAFGVVLWEMLTGRRMFEGETVSDTLASVIKDAPDLDALPADTPPVVRALIARCLEKDPKRRLQSIGEARIALDDRGEGSLLSTVGAPAIDAPEPAARPARWPWLAAMVLVAFLGVAIGTRIAGPPPAEPELKQFDLSPSGLTVSYPRNPALSPDGRRLAYFEGDGLYIRDLHTLEATLVPGADTGTAPFWSPDSRWLAFGADQRIHRVPAAGGRPEVVAFVAFSTLDGADWGPDGTMVLAPDTGPLQVVSADGGDPRALFPLRGSESDYHTPTFLPGGRGVLFTTHDQDGRETIEVFADGERKVILKIPGARLEYAAFSPRPGSDTEGAILYHRRQTNDGLWALPFDLDTLEPTGDPFLVDADGGFPSVADDGSLLYARGIGAIRTRFVIVDPDGTIAERVSEGLESTGRFRLSPDASQILYEHDGDIWVYDIARDSRTRLTLAEGTASHPTWIGDGSRFAYGVLDGGGGSMSYVRSIDGTGEAVPLLLGYAVGSSPGTDRLVYSRFNRSTTIDLFQTSLTAPDSGTAFVQTPRMEDGAVISPDGRFVAYMSNVGGTNDVYLRTIDGDGPWQVSVDGGAWPQWTPDGRAIVFRTRAGGAARMMRVAVETEPTVEFGQPEILFAASEAPTIIYQSGFGAYAPLPDGRLVMLERVIDEDAREPSLVYVEDWWAAYGRD